MPVAKRAKSETITLNGVRFRRYPDSSRWCDRMYYNPGIAARKRGVRRLHSELWISRHGPIPKDHVVHHRDGNPLNNDPDNLECIHRDEHYELHAAEKRIPTGDTDHLKKIRLLASEWHRSEEGRSWHREHGKACWDGKRKRRERCEHCDKIYWTRSMHGRERFCSINCRAAARRKSGVDNEPRTCGYCGATFTVNKYAKTRFCSRICGSLSHKRPKATATG